jgi:hypothetical protein
LIVDYYCTAILINSNSMLNRLICIQTLMTHRVLACIFNHFLFTHHIRHVRAWPMQLIKSTIFIYIILEVGIKQDEKWQSLVKGQFKRINKVPYRRDVVFYISLSLEY